MILGQVPESLHAVPMLGSRDEQGGRARARPPRELAALAEGRIAAEQWAELARRHAPARAAA